MAEYIRKKRYITYHNSLCKKYLRRDFNYQCAYCKSSEAETIYGSRAFEIDHFKPQEIFSDDEELHHYDNLYYACNICNGASGKSDTWYNCLLNPCNDNIYGKGDGFHINEMADFNDDFKLKPITKRGEMYIDTFKLNQYDQRRIREKRFKLKQDEEKKLSKICYIEKLLKEIDINDSNEEVLKTLQLEIFDLKKTIDIGNLPYAEFIEDEYTKKFKAEISKYVELKDEFSDIGLDYEITYKSKKAKCDVYFLDSIIFKNGIKFKKISILQAEEWTTKDFNICMILFDKSNSKIYYKNVKNQLINARLNQEGKFFTLSFDQNNILCDTKIESFYTEIFT